MGMYEMEKAKSMTGRVVDERKPLTTRLAMNSEGRAV
jgi:hypothetical protein